MLTNSAGVVFLSKSARNFVITSEARLPSRSVRREVSRALNVWRNGVQHPQAGAGVCDDDLEAICKHLSQKVAEWAGVEQFDDTTILVLSME
jgi:hypothetical protein